MSNDNNNKMEVRDAREGEWLWTNKAILFSQYVNDSAYRVYSGLAAYSGNNDQRSWPSLITLSTKLNLAKSTVIRAIRLLEALGLISARRIVGSHNIYTLLPCKEIKPPTAVNKKASPHHRLIEVFHRSTMKFRNIKPVWGQKDVASLKRVLTSEILTEQQIEQLIIYFTGAPQFKKFSPSMSTFFSSGIFNGLMNGMKNDPEFWKILDRLAVEFYGEPKERTLIPQNSMAKMIEALTAKMTIKVPVYEDN